MQADLKNPICVEILRVFEPDNVNYSPNTHCIKLLTN